MKKTIKSITAALSAAVMCALPMAGSISANAGEQYTTYRTTYFVKYDNANVKNTSITVTTKKGLTKLGRKNFNNSGDFGAIHGSGGQTYDHVNTNWDRKKFSGDNYVKKGILYNETSKTIYGGNFEKYLVSKTALNIAAADVNGGSAAERVGYFAVNVGDVTGAWNSTSFTDFKADGITGMDSVEISRLINAGYTDIAAYSKRVDYTSENNESVRRLRAMIAGDINNDGKLTENDATVILYWVVGKVKDFSAFNGVADNKIVSLAESMKY